MLKNIISLFHKLWVGIQQIISSMISIFRKFKIIFINKIFSNTKISIIIGQFYIIIFKLIRVGCSVGFNDKLRRLFKLIIIFKHTSCNDL